MSVIKSLRTQVAEWNNMFPLDYWWRKKHNITFNSLEHKQANQLDIYFEWLEEKMYEEYQEEFEKNKENTKLYDKGIILKKQEETTEEDESLFDKIDILAFNQKSDSLKIEE